MALLSPDTAFYGGLSMLPARVFPCLRVPLTTMARARSICQIAIGVDTRIYVNKGHSYVVCWDKHRDT